MTRQNPLLIVTGFGSFCGVKNNPSKWIVEQLRKQNSDDDASFKVLDVAAHQVEKELHALAVKIPPDAHAIWVHFGVHDGAKTFLLEAQAVNEADFRIPDEAGWQPSRQRINQHLPLDHTLRVTLPLQKLVDVLPHDVEVSHDAGRFVCNYTLYRSLERCQQQRQLSHGLWAAVFVHVPTFTIKSQQEQLSFAKSLLQSLKTCELPVSHDNSPSEQQHKDAPNGLGGFLHVKPMVSLLSNPWQAAAVALLISLLWKKS